MSKWKNFKAFVTDHDVSRVLLGLLLIAIGVILCFYGSQYKYEVSITLITGEVIDVEMLGYSKHYVAVRQDGIRKEIPLPAIKYIEQRRPDSHKATDSQPTQPVQPTSYSL